MLLRKEALLPSHPSGLHQVGPTPAPLWGGGGEGGQAGDEWGGWVGRGGGVALQATHCARGVTAGAVHPAKTIATWVSPLFPTAPPPAPPGVDPGRVLRRPDTGGSVHTEGVPYCSALLCNLPSVVSHTHTHWVGRSGVNMSYARG
jgi:hypothetical protein